LETDGPSIAEVNVHFLELGNYYAGDCTLIDIGDTEILIDAGSRKDSATTIKKYVDRYCEDGTLEYVIATHAHQDHIAAFVGNPSGNSYTGILYQYKIGTIIQYSKTNSTSQISKDFQTAVTKAQSKGTTVHTVLECWNNENGAQRSYQIADGVTMNFLYQKYYETKTSDENDYSVCMLLSQGDNHYLFTGDLEKHGEQSLVESNNLPDCVLFKGGHHGSPTSNTPALLSVIKPDIVCVCCCCGSDEYTSNVANMFPSQAFVDNVAPYTDKVYVTTMVTADGEGYQSMNGNIIVTSDGTEVSVACSNNDILFKDTDWFKKNRTMPDAWK
jgi:competence protein ComEC